jgi:galactokinase
MQKLSNILLEKVRSVFLEHFQSKPSIVARAPGRVNLIGEHTDYNDGFVLPCAIDYQTMIAASPRHDLLVRVVALDMQNEQDEFVIAKTIAPSKEKPWSNYIRAVVQMMVNDGFELTGADLVISGNVPQGAGLSSSASLEVAVAQTFKALYGLTDFNTTQMALLAQRAENEYVGCKCGIMDQLISAQGLAHHALLIDCRSLLTQAVHLPQDLAVMIVHSNVQRGLVDSEYNTRRQQCEAAAKHYQVKALRDIDYATLIQNRGALDELIFKRARHVVSENQRTLDAAHALAHNDIQSMGVLMAQSHASMRDDFEITVPAIDQLVAILQNAIGQAGGARMTGGGFGGCVVALMPQHLVEKASLAVLENYQAPNGRAATIYVCNAQNGVSLLEE